MKKGMFSVLAAISIAAVVLAVCGCGSEEKDSLSADGNYPVVVDYDISVAEMIQAGKYDRVNDKIKREHFGIPKRGEVEVALQLVRFNIPFNNREVLAELDKRDLGPANLPELFAFGAKYPKVQQQFPVIALGSVWVDSLGHRCVVSLREYDDGKRSLDIIWEPRLWHGSCVFLAVSK